MIELKEQKKCSPSEKKGKKDTAPSPSPDPQSKTLNLCQTK